MTHKEYHRPARLAGVLFLPLAFTLLAGCSEEQAGGGGFSMPPMPVEVARAGRSLVQDRFEAVGTIEAIDAITVVSEVDATVISVPFKEGSEMRAGDLIAQLDDLQLAAEFARAEALLAQTSAAYERVRKVVEQKAAAEQDLDDAAAALKVAEANLAVAQARLAKTRITAPFNGIVGTRRVSKGTFLRAGQPITELANIDQIRVYFSVPERFLARLSSGAGVTVSTTAYQDVELTGTVIAVEPIIDSETRSARVVAKVLNTKRRFRPGMSANISAVLGERADAVTIPNEAVFSSGREAFVFLVKPDSTVTRIALTLGTRMEKDVEVLAGLDPEALVVRAGHQKLFEGARVLPVTSQPDTNK